MNADEVEKKARAAVAGTVAQTLELQAAIQVAAIRAREVGMTRETWLVSAGQSWDALSKTWTGLENLLSGALSAVAEPEPVREVTLPVARTLLAAHVDACAACARGVAAHVTACPGCSLDVSTGGSKFGEHRRGVGGCARYVELAKTVERLTAGAAAPIVPG